MKIQSIKQQNTNFKGIGDISGKLIKAVAERPGLVAGLASASVVAQKLVLSASELSMGPAMDIAIGKTITKITDEKDGRTNQSAKLQAVRTAAQTIGGTITGVAVRALCIGLMTSLFVKAGKTAGREIYKVINKNQTKNSYELQKRAESLGRDIGGVASVAVMMITNFLLDMPIINYINKKISDVVFKENKTPKEKETVNG